MSEIDTTIAKLEEYLKGPDWMLSGLHWYTDSFCVTLSDYDVKRTHSRRRVTGYGPTIHEALKEALQRIEEGRFEKLP